MYYCFKPEYVTIFLNNSEMQETIQTILPDRLTCCPKKLFYRAFQKQDAACRAASIRPAGSILL